ncbi:hypothetical protein ACWDR0_05480 [Streptomyces sp. NPDC003691]
MGRRRDEDTGGGTRRKTPSRGTRDARVRLPGFMREDGEDDIGLGDLVSRATSAVGVPPCGGCTRRAERLNHWVTFTKRRR